MQLKEWSKNKNWNTVRRYQPNRYRVQYRVQYRPNQRYYRYDVQYVQYLMATCYLQYR